MTTTFIPSHINYGKTERTSDNKVSYFTILKSKRVIFACIVVALNAITYDFLNPILASVMYTYYGITEARVGWLFFLMGTGYVLS